MPNKPWHNLSHDEVLKELGGDAAAGLSDAEAAARLARGGPNELVERGQKGPWRILAAQFTSTMVIVLIVAGVVSAFLGDFKDAGAILAIVVLNAILGFRQEYKAEQAMAALKRLAVPRVRVRRGGRLAEISSRELVPGDVVLLEAGTVVPADCRLLETASLKAQEASLTGESQPVDKRAAAVLDPGAALGDRVNMAYMGTAVTNGRGAAVVTATGMATELGRIAAMIQGIDETQTPLQKRLAHLGRVLVVLALILVGIVFAMGLWRGTEEIRDLFLIAVSMAVAAVPEGLPAVVTIALAIGAQRMLRRRALIRKLPAVETLGSVTVICSDKTGTLTENRMTVTTVEAGGRRLEVGPQPEGPVPAGEPGPDLTLCLAAAAACNDASVADPSKDPRNQASFGDPTEVALVVAAARFRLEKAGIEALLPRRAEVPFDSDRKRMTTIHELPAAERLAGSPLEGLAAWRRSLGTATHVAFVKGAVDGMLGASRQVLSAGGTGAEPLSDERRRAILEANNRLAAEGTRVLGVAYRPLAAPPADAGPAIESELVFIGMMGMVDPPRKEAADAVRVCREAGIRPIMITGDHPLTAASIARQLGIAGEGARIVTGEQLAAASVEELEALVPEVSVYARVSPEHKLKIVQALQNRGQVVAMTGDGVNDAPALKKADIGVAMGITGTDVSKEASDMVLTDDNFATIVAAVEEGRAIYSNVRKFIKYLLTTNAGEIMVMLFAPLLKMPLPLLPLQILWINLVTDGLPALALGVEPAEKDAMKRPPHPPGESIFARGMGVHVLWVSLLMTVVTLGVGWWAYRAELPGWHWQTMVFTTLTLSQLGHVMAIRSSRQSLFRMGLFSNPLMLGAVGVTFLLQLALVYLPFAQKIFGTQPLSVGALGVSLAASVVVFTAVEVEKLLRRRGDAMTR
ncbi:MAG TPA: cation-translocating P-type ATPase [Planctomycetota bacterium]|nr:cation-translocating P-type ATPase [Planctomycetota bacterium]